ncbi:PREDICTED: E3 ubiquitin-protein ligase SHPRH-like isoform X2 [Amphimedon queenslandica]|uniref:E3 ubiquitin-protein ligase SHPRH n=1 Tax=Amphimedon queenslandica TaxID=400682 RepID=A0AAN0IW74_AMPQE|nr:PREDICTED: E3 ubiquitin-protein ligase SHPRH-like isoform X2 [Amphimedon queenslandica]|eukprot:XP_019848691.1 PREDICTED: E3 ubiquitin-protein ligase SHPRH-like isoform X2 [Amphimedon queenslandica]
MTTPLNMSTRKRKRRNLSTSQKRHLESDAESILCRSSENDQDIPPDIMKRVGLAHYNDCDLSWTPHTPPPPTNYSEGHTIIIPLLKGGLEGVERLVTGWHVVGHLRFDGNFTGFSELLLYCDQLFLQWGIDAVQFIVKCSIGIDDRECYVSFSTNLKLSCDFNWESVDELYRLYRIGGAKFVCCLPFDVSSNRLTVLAVFGDFILQNERTLDDLPQKSSSLIKASLLQSLHPNVFTEPHDIVPGCSELERSLGNELNHVVTTIAAKILQFYKFVRVHQQYLLKGKATCDLPATIPLLTADLLDYQKRAVQWMLYKERADNWRDIEEEKEEEELQHVLWREVPVEGHSSLYYNLFTGRLSLVKFLMPSYSKGGILADEMGLGKTVEILALILIHQWSCGSSDIVKEYIQNNHSISGRNIDAEGFVSEGSSITLNHFNKSSSGAGENAGPIDVQNTGTDNLQGQLLAGTDVSQEEEEETLCTCGNPSNLYVQCDICSLWCHAPCVNYVKEKCEDFICIKCLYIKPIDCGSTLVIVPETLLYQWLAEISKHTVMDSAQIMVYNGVFKEYINPLHLISKDIILVTYETIRKELDRVRHHEFSIKLRRPKSYAYPPSPLLAIKWWRICLDEAQMVESSHSKATEMTCKLLSQNRWCVTGTPVERDLRDLYGLVNFLDYRPYSVNHWWNKLILLPYCKGDPRPIVALFSKMMWRNSKEDVADELNWPKLEEQEHSLSLSPVEAYYYQRQEEFCLKMFNAVSNQVSEASTSLSDLDSTLVNKLLRPLHKLRLACCHPQLVKNGYINFSSFKKRYMSMEELLKKMIVQAKQEGRESLRQLVAAINGMAGIHILNEKFQDAVDAYREAMYTWNNYKDDYECDRLQRIHTMENLSNLIKEGHSSHCCAVSDDQLDSLAAKLRSEYIKKQHNNVNAAVRALSVAASTVKSSLNKAYTIQDVHLKSEVLPLDNICHGPNEEAEVHVHVEEADDNIEINAEDLVEDTDDELNDDVEEADKEVEAKEVEHFTVTVINKAPEFHWWSSAVSWSIANDLSSELFSSLQYELNLFPDFIFGFHSLIGFQYSVLNFIDTLQNERERILHMLNNLTHSTTESDIVAATQCHFRIIQGAALCLFCKAENALKNYEKLLFSQYQIRTDDNASSRSSSVYERLLKCGPLSLIESGKSYMNYLESLRNEFKFVTRLWMAAEQQIRAYDELSMAAKRFKLLPSSGSDHMQINDIFLSHSELSSKRLEFESDAKMSKLSLERNLRQLTYLRNLTKTNDSEEPSNCPICTGPLQRNDGWAVLPCGHCYCLECIYSLICRHAPSSHQPVFLQIEEAISRKVQLSCPMCREKLSSHEINFVKSSLLEEESLPLLKGSYSTKIAAVTGILLKIKQNEPSTKSLVFSSSMQVLNFISHALFENDIDHAFLTNKKQYQVNLKKFKTSLTLNVLLMHLSSGSKGLNIVEATRVILVEPFLNIGAELQAIGRVHRMGQTKPVVVHKFYVKNSVEERIKEMMSNSAEMATSLSAKDKYGFTVDQLKKLFC